MQSSVTSLIPEQLEGLSNQIIEKSLNSFSTASFQKLLKKEKRKKVLKREVIIIYCFDKTLTAQNDSKNSFSLVNLNLEKIKQYFKAVIYLFSLIKYLYEILS